MWNIFLGIILSCIGVIAIAFTLFILIAIIDITIKQIRGGKNGINKNR